MKQLIVLGNGFDLACELKSSYGDFFLARFNELFCTKGEKFNSLEEMGGVLDKKRKDILLDICSTRNNINALTGSVHDCDYFKKYHEKWDNNAQLNRWDIIFLFAQFCIEQSIDAYEWQDVETIIFEVISIALKSNYNSKIKYKRDLILGTKSWKGEELFKKLIYDISYVGKNTSEEIATELLEELKKFETNFSNFISKQVNLDNSKQGYVSNAVDLYEKISKYSKSKAHLSGDKVDVLSFNYSLDEKFVDIIDQEIDDKRLNSWSNIHGIAHSKKTPYYPAPIFGIDNHGILDQNDLRILFTKPYRIIDEDINSARSAEGYEDTDLISIYGHSLSEADYSYFETLFDENKLYYSKCKIEYYYYPGINESEKILKRREAITRIYNLLTNYGKTLSDTHGSSIVNKLNLENRISVIPTNN